MTDAMHQILVVEDEPAIRNVLKVLLEAERYRVIEAASALRAQVEVRSHKPDLLLLDLGLPDGDGLQIIRRVRAWSPIPIIVLSARTQEAQKIAALDLGADDYVTKPFSAAELVARVRAALRRNVRNLEQTGELALGPVRIDLATRTASGTDGSIHLTPLEYRVLECLARHLGAIVTQQQLIREVWGPERLGDTRGLRVCIMNLRAKVEADRHKPRYLLTEPGLGYRLSADESVSAAG